MFHFHSNILHMNKSELNKQRLSCFYRFKSVKLTLRNDLITGSSTQEPGVTSEECFTCEHNDLGQGVWLSS